MAAVLFGGYNLALKLSLTAGMAMLALLMAVMPWLIWKSLQFSLYNSSYRGIRFGFDGSARGAYFHYLLLPLLGVLSLGLLYPFVHQRIKRFQHTNSRYGSVPFSFDASVGGFYKVYLYGFGLLMAGSVVMGFLLMIAIALKKLETESMAWVPVAIYPYVLVVMFVAMASLQNLIWNHTYLGQHGFRSTMKTGKLASLYITNTLAIIFTLGLFIPFAVVRALKYRLECTSLVVNGSLDDITAGQRADVGAIGEGAADIGGFDLAL
ncbi:uncharacterized membrane protein YjgN (DUF898 family) [Massilia umbonata]|uniref:Uncharacterized membrane protein YjgN (DUF898 family) n=1 Tax=Pseudoduganella umbonata TaxID=864828 RepID=A0A7W5HB55_9BURK|nr:uncharacterized membrane protein YjgN (DUF898 family) [Pseudoduganella umbonata]